MRKWFLSLMLALSLVVPASASAQSGLIINEMAVRVWPEYDDPRVLVLCDFSVAPGTAFPAEITLRIPADAELLAVARDDGNGNLINAPFNEPTRVGDWLTVTMPIENQNAYHVEYYQAMARDGQKRHIEYTWPGDYQVNTLVVEVLEPFGVTGFKSEPALPNPYQNGDLKGHNGTFSSLSAGTPWTITIDYSRAIDTLSVAGQNVQAGGTADTNSVQQFVQQNLVLILVGVAVVLIMVGIVWFWVSGQESSGNGKSRKRHVSPATEVSVDVAYCHECGKRAMPGDKFCRACGVKLRKEA